MDMAMSKSDLMNFVAIYECVCDISERSIFFCSYRNVWHGSFAGIWIQLRAMFTALVS